MNFDPEMKEPAQPPSISLAEWRRLCASPDFPHQFIIRAVPEARIIDPPPRRISPREYGQTKKRRKRK